MKRFLVAVLCFQCALPSLAIDKINGSNGNGHCLDELGLSIQKEIRHQTVKTPNVVRRYALRFTRRVRFQIERACRGKDCTPEIREQAVKDAVKDLFTELRVGAHRVCAAGVWVAGLGAVCLVNWVVATHAKDVSVAILLGTVATYVALPLLNHVIGPLDRMLGGRIVAWSSGSAAPEFSPAPYYHQIWLYQMRVPGTTLKGAEIISDLKMHLARDFFEAAQELRDGRKELAAKLVGEAALTIGSEYRFLLNRSEDIAMLSIARRARITLPERFALGRDFKELVMAHIRSADDEANRNGLVMMQYWSLISDWLDPEEDPMRTAHIVRELQEPVIEDTSGEPPGLMERLLYPAAEATGLSETPPK